MRKYNISANLVRNIEQLFDKATSAFQMNGSIGEWFRTTMGERQGCLLSLTFFNIFLERIRSDDLEEHDGKVSLGAEIQSTLVISISVISNNRLSRRENQIPVKHQF